MLDGMGQMFVKALENIGLNPEQLKADVENFMLYMKAQGEKIDANQQRIEAMLARISASLEELEAKVDEITPQTSTTHILENGEPSGNLITSEKFPQEMIDDVFNTTATIGGPNGRRERSNNEE